ncbi:VOC family protein [Minwuia thermotolerans]|nr:VOC family protein [Minwuia thermotolerans]
MTLPMDRNNLQMFHINVNCSNLDRSVAFYKALGFKVINDFSMDEPADGRDRTIGERTPGLAEILGVDPTARMRAAFLRLGDDARATILDLIEWIEPKPGGAPAHMTQMGMARLCFRVKDCDGAYQAAVAAGAECFTAPTMLAMGGTRQKVFCCYDPDRTILEFQEFQKP